jgi:hypothetical protein
MNALLRALLAVAVALPLVGLWTPAATADDPTIPRGPTSEIALPASNILAVCDPPSFFQPNPTEWSINPDSVALAGLPDPDSLPPAGHLISVTPPADLSLFQTITISWTGNTDCISFNGQIVLSVCDPVADPVGCRIPVANPELAAYREELRALERQRQKMLDAMKELEEKNKVFCAVSGFLLDSTNPVPAVNNGWGQACGAIPGLVKAYVDADKKLDRIDEQIDKLNQEINGLQQVAGETALSPSIKSAAATRLVSTHMASKAQGRDRLAVLKARRQGALAAMGSLASAIGGKELDVAESAQTAASRLGALPETCTKVMRHLKKVGLGAKYSRSKILAGLRHLKTNPLPPRVARFGRALGLSRAQMKRLVREAKAVPKRHVTGMAVSDMFCSPRLDKIDKSLAAAFATLASSLLAPPP